MSGRLRKLGIVMFFGGLFGVGVFDFYTPEWYVSLSVMAGGAGLLLWLY